METIKVNTSQHVDIDYPVAGLGERIAARLIDLGFFIALSFLLLMLFAIPGLSKNNIVAGGIAIFYAVCYVFYNLICEIFMDGQSAGKRIMKIKVISIDGGQASLGQYFIRWLFRLVDFVLSSQLAGVICVAISAKKQRIGDIVAGTAVIKTVARTNFNHIAFHPVEEDYVPYFENANVLSDSDVELIHEVLTTYYKTGNVMLLYTASLKVAELLSFKLPEEEHRVYFLETVVKDYKHLTSMV